MTKGMLCNFNTHGPLSHTPELNDVMLSHSLCYPSAFPVNLHLSCLHTAAFSSWSWLLCDVILVEWKKSTEGRKHAAMLLWFSQEKESS